MTWARQSLCDLTAPTTSGTSSRENAEHSLAFDMVQCVAFKGKHIVKTECLTFTPLGNNTGQRKLFAIRHADKKNTQF